MNKLIVANWKMNPPTQAKAKSLAASYGKMRSGKSAEIVICPPVLYLPFISLKNAKRGAQNVSFMERAGAYTGEISAGMLKDAKVSHIIIGHSEQRALGETNAHVARKTDAVLAAKMTPIVCVGETESVRSRGSDAAIEYVRKQLEESVRPALHHAKFSAHCVVAYEPLWAIGTGKACTREDAAQMARVIREFVSSHLPPASAKNSLRVLYGGSVTAANAADFFGEDALDGVLVGGASLSPKEFSRIVSAAT